MKLQWCRERAYQTCVVSECVTPPPKRRHPNKDQWQSTSKPRDSRRLAPRVCKVAVVKAIQVDIHVDPVLTCVDPSARVNPRFASPCKTWSKDIFLVPWKESFSHYYFKSAGIRLFVFTKPDVSKRHEPMLPSIKWTKIDIPSPHRKRTIYPSLHPLVCHVVLIVEYLDSLSTEIKSVLRDVLCKCRCYCKISCKKMVFLWRTGKNIADLRDKFNVQWRILSKIVERKVPDKLKEPLTRGK